MADANANRPAYGHASIGGPDYLLSLTASGGPHRCGEGSGRDDRNYQGSDDRACMTPDVAMHYRHGLSCDSSRYTHVGTGVNARLPGRARWAIPGASVFFRRI